jgi:hypothetical protein
LFVAHCAFSFGEKNGELYQLTTFLRKLQLLSETAIDLFVSGLCHTTSKCQQGPQGEQEWAQRYIRQCPTENQSENVEQAPTQEPIAQQAATDTQQTSPQPQPQANPVAQENPVNEPNATDQATTESRPKD